MKPYFTIAFLFLLTIVSAQRNVELLSQVEYPGKGDGNDVWGYVAPDSSEYAIMGLQTGVSVVDITDPRNPVEIDFIDQNRIIWRDIKTWGEYAYVTSENPDDGVLVIDMRDVPNSVSYENIFLDVPSGETIGSCHNIFIDEFGFAYLAGCNVNSGGVEIFDLKPVAGQLEYVGGINLAYSHDVYARDNLVYSSEINRGHFAIYDVTDKTDITLLATQETPFNFTHNAWLSDDGNTLFTTDERGNAPVASYDVSDPNNIQYLDEYRPAETLGDGVIPHNVHVWDDWLIISYYSDGCIIVDAARPDNLIEVGNFDTFLNTAVGFNGAWGAYPFFPSGTIIIGDIQAGLYVLGPTYVRASYIEGMVTDAADGSPINNAIIEVAAIGLSDFSKAGGQYKTGTVESGTYEISCRRTGYKTVTREINLVNGDLHIENFELELLPKVNLSGMVISAEDGSIIPGAEISLQVDEQRTILVANDEGNFAIDQLLGGSYEIVAGSWGYKYKVVGTTVFDETDLAPRLIIELEKGYEDNFFLDLGWESVFDGDMGAWERVKPIGTQPPGFPIFVAPDNDSDDYGNRAYVTGQSNDFQAGLLVGRATLSSPEFDPTYLELPTMSFEYYLWATSQSAIPSGQPLVVYLSNGDMAREIASYTMEELEVRDWTISEEFILQDYLPLTTTMQVIVDIENTAQDAVEAGFDNFRVYENKGVSVEDVLTEELIVAYPNPSSGVFEIRLPSQYQDGEVKVAVTDVHGSLVFSELISSGGTVYTLKQNFDSGIYFLQLYKGDRKSKSIKLIKL